MEKSGTTKTDGIFGAMDSIKTSTPLSRSTKKFWEDVSLENLTVKKPLPVNNAADESFASTSNGVADTSLTSHRNASLVSDNGYLVGYHYQSLKIINHYISNRPNFVDDQNDVRGNYGWTANDANKAPQQEYKMDSSDSENEGQRVINCTKKSLNKSKGKMKREENENGSKQKKKKSQSQESVLGDRIKVSETKRKLMSKIPLSENKQNVVNHSSLKEATVKLEKINHKAPCKIPLLKTSNIKSKLNVRKSGIKSAVAPNARKSVNGKIVGKLMDGKNKAQTEHKKTDKKKKTNKSVRRKESSKNSTEASPDSSINNSLSSSRKLFSESQEKELIDSLDLTSGDNKNEPLDGNENIYKKEAHNVSLNSIRDSKNKIQTPITDWLAKKLNVNKASTRNIESIPSKEEKITPNETKPESTEENKSVLNKDSEKETVISEVKKGKGTSRKRHAAQQKNLLPVCVPADVVEHTVENTEKIPEKESEEKAIDPGTHTAVKNQNEKVKQRNRKGKSVDSNPSSTLNSDKRTKETSSLSVGLEENPSTKKNVNKEQEEVVPTKEADIPVEATENKEAKQNKKGRKRNVSKATKNEAIKNNVTNHCLNSAPETVDELKNTNHILKEKQLEEENTIESLRIKRSSSTEQKVEFNVSSKKKASTRIKTKPNTVENNKVNNENMDNIQKNLEDLKKPSNRTRKKRIWEENEPNTMNKPENVNGVVSTIQDSTIQSSSKEIEHSETSTTEEVVGNTKQSESEKQNRENGVTRQTRGRQKSLLQEANLSNRKKLTNVRKTRTSTRLSEESEDDQVQDVSNTKSQISSETLEEFQVPATNEVTVDSTVSDILQPNTSAVSRRLKRKALRGKKLSPKLPVIIEDKENTKEMSHETSNSNEAKDVHLITSSTSIEPAKSSNSTNNVSAADTSLKRKLETDTAATVEMSTKRRKTSKEGTSVQENDEGKIVEDKHTEANAAGAESKTLNVINGAENANEVNEGTVDKPARQQTKEQPVSNNLPESSSKKDEITLAPSQIRRGSQIRTEGQFKVFDDLVFEQNDGYAFAVSWSTNVFKTGMLKILPNHSATGETFEGRYFIAVLLQGIAKAYVQNRKVVMQKWEQLLIPPNSKWKVKNIGSNIIVISYSVICIK